MRGRCIAVMVISFAVGVAIALPLAQVGGAPSARPGRDAADGAPHEPAPRRIICMGPNVAECVFALDRGDRVVGVSDWTMYPPEARAKVRVGSTFAPSMEKLVALQPDLVIAAGGQEKLAELCRQRGLPLLNVEMDDLASIYRGLGTLGERLGAPDEAQALCDTMRWTLEAVERRVRGRRRPRVFLCLGRMPDSLSGMLTSNAEGFLGELLQIAGGENVLADAPIRYSQVSVESLVKRAPEVIIEMRGGEQLSARQRRELVEDWRALSILPAVRNGQVHVLTESYLKVPGPRTHLIARKLAMVLHPEAFP